MNEYISKEFMLKNLETDKMNNFIRYVKEFPAADVQPVKHGKWLPKIEDIYEFSECSECGNMESCETPYCAQCGAIMDGETK